MATVVSASENATKVVIKERGPRGVDGTPGVDGVGFNTVRTTQIDNPTVWLYKKNRLVNVIDNLLFVSRNSAGTFQDMHKRVNVEAIDFPRESFNGWLIEPARTNLILESQTFELAPWVQSNLTVTPDAIAAPDLTVTADQLIESAGASIKDISQPVTVANTTEHTLSVFAKANSRDFIYLTDTANSGNGAFFDLTLGVVGTVDAGIVATIEPYINGWYRCSIQSTSTSTVGGMVIQLADIDGAGSYTGDGTSGVYVWGAQIEASNFVTSYNLTDVLQVLREADTHLFKVLNNIPFMAGGFSCMLQIENYNEQALSQDLITIDDSSLAGFVFKINTTAGGFWEATIKGNDLIDYPATTVISATSIASQKVIVTVSSIGVINIYVDGNVLNGTNTIATGIAGAVNINGNVNIGLGSDFRANIQGLRFWEFELNTDEISYLN